MTQWIIPKWRKPISGRTSTSTQGKGWTEPQQFRELCNTDKQSHRSLWCFCRAKGAWFLEGQWSQDQSLTFCSNHSTKAGAHPSSVQQHLGRHHTPPLRPCYLAKDPSCAVVSWQGAPWFNMSKQFSPKSSMKLTWPATKNKKKTIESSESERWNVQNEWSESNFVICHSLHYRGISIQSHRSRNPKDTRHFAQTTLLAARGTVTEQPSAPEKISSAACS